MGLQAGARRELRRPCLIHYAFQKSRYSEREGGVSSSRSLRGPTERKTVWFRAAYGPSRLCDKE